MLQPYSKIDFKALADSFPPLKQFLFKNAAGDYNLDFKDEAANRTLTRALLKRDFGLEMTLLCDRLCPPHEPRLNYILWLSSLVSALGAEDHVVGLDIGTGSTAIYPLIACSTHGNWRFLATDIDPKSLASAAVNLSKNPAVAERVHLLSGTEDGPILFPLQPQTLAEMGIGAAPRPCVTFSMCNPPFYSDLQDVSRSADNKELDPHAVCTGALVEMITPGGEVNFVRRILDESITLQDVCGWYTSLLGKMSSVAALVTTLNEKGIDNYAIGEIVQGNTRRWIIGWSFLDIRLPDTLAQPSSQSLKAIAPPPNTLRHTLPAGSPKLTYEALRGALLDIPKLRIEMEETLKTRISAHEVTWTRSARRRLARNVSSEGDATSDTGSLIMVSDVSIIDEKILEVRWIRGRDRGVFESFWGYLSGKLSSSR
ncbi:ribosomal RNA large subunit methyltransferase F [Ceratobasidium sp. AG-Ba]|nr:ribosomal RNA large subunit methyltransferase F [Ceratobasidium sp. AG-Ba]